VEKQPIPISEPLVWPDRCSNPRITAHANHYATDAVTHDLKPWGRILYCHDSPHDVKPLCRMLYCTDSHTIQIRCAFNYTVTTHAQCGTILHQIVLSRLTHDFKAMWRLLYCKNVHSCESFKKNIVLSRQTHNVKPVCRTLYCHADTYILSKYIPSLQKKL
jgi:hypothetical protein